MRVAFVSGMDYHISGAVQRPHMAIAADLLTKHIACRSVGDRADPLIIAALDFVKAEKLQHFCSVVSKRVSNARLSIIYAPLQKPTGGSMKVAS